jgi:hypothetical protein
MGTAGAGEGRLNAIIGVSGPYDPYQEWKAGNGLTPTIDPTPEMKGVANACVAVAGVPAQPTNTDEWHSVWPTMYAGLYASANDSRFMLFHGRSDDAVSPALSRQLHNKLTDNGVDSTLVFLEGEHTQAILWNNAYWSARALAFAKEATA